MGARFLQVPVHGDHGRLSSLSIGGDPFVLRARSREPIGWYRGLDHAAASRRRKLSLRFAGTHGRGWDSPRKPITHTRYTRRLAAPPPSSTRLPPNLVNGGPPPLFFFLSLSLLVGGKMLLQRDRHEEFYSIRT